MARLKLKTSKSASKRFKISSKGNIRHRHVRMDHFNAKDTGSMRRGKRPQKSLAKQNEKDIKNLMPYI